MPEPDDTATLAGALSEAQAILAAWLEPDRVMSDRETLDAPLAVLDREGVVGAVRAVLP